MALARVLAYVGVVTNNSVLINLIHSQNILSIRDELV